MFEFKKFVLPLGLAHIVEHCYAERRQATTIKEESNFKHTETNLRATAEAFNPKPSSNTRLKTLK